MSEIKQKIDVTTSNLNDISSQQTPDFEIDEYQQTLARVSEQVKTTGFYTYAEERKLIRKVDLRLMPLLILLYLLKNLDVNNVSYLVTLNTGTKTNILTELNMTRDDWAWVSTIYFIPFIIFEVPSTMLLKYSTPRVHQFRIALLWGATTACQSAVKNKAGLYALRFLLGVFEAGLFPGQLAQLTYWYRPDEITTRMAFLGVLGSFSNVLTAFIAYGFSFASGKGGLSAWQWIFLIEGILTVVASFFFLYLLPNYPDSADKRSTWLTNEEKAFLVARLPPTSPKSTDANFSWSDTWRAFKRPKILLFSFLKLFQITGTYGLGFWLPSIIQSFGITSATTTPLMAIPSAFLATVSGIAFSLLVDRAKLKPPHLVVGTLTVSFAAFLVLTLVTNKGVLYGFIILATIATAADGSVLSSWLHQSSTKGATEVGFALSFSNSVGQVGGVIGPQIFRSKFAPRYVQAYGICLGFIGLGFIIAIVLWYLTLENTNQIQRDRKERLRERSIDLNARPIYNSVDKKSEISNVV